MTISEALIQRVARGAGRRLDEAAYTLAARAGKLTVGNKLVPFYYIIKDGRTVGVVVPVDHRWGAYIAKGYTSNMMRDAATDLKLRRTAVLGNTPGDALVALVSKVDPAGHATAATQYPVTEGR